MPGDYSNLHDLCFSGISQKYPQIYNNLEGLPWYQLGRPVMGSSSIAEAISTAKLDSKVEKRPVYYPIYGEDGITIVERPRIPNTFAIVNTQTNEVLGIVPGSYELKQNTAAFAAFEPLVEDGILQPDYAGSLGSSNTTIWILAKIGDPYEVVADDLIMTYVLLINTHDGRHSHKIKVIAAPIRLACVNTERMIMAKKHYIYTLNIRPSATGNSAARVSKIMHHIIGHHQELRSVARRFVSYPVNQEIIRGLLERLFPDLAFKTSAERPRISRSAAKIIQLFEEEPIPEARGSAWSLYNAVTGYVDHFRPTRGFSKMNRINNHLESMWFGSGAYLKDIAMRYLLKVTK